MTLRIYKLNFSRVHFGEGLLEESAFTFDASRLYSALCHEALQRSQKALQNLQLSATSEEFAISDAFPYIEHQFESAANPTTTFFLPKPLLTPPRDEALSDEDGRSLAKRAKKLQYIPVERYAEYISGRADLAELSELQKFGEFGADVKVSISDFPEKDSDRTKPYSVGTFTFGKNAGLYFFARMPEGFTDEFEELLNGLGYSGIGGKRTAGFGRFEVEMANSAEVDSLAQALSGVQEALGKQEVLLSSAVLSGARAGDASLLYGAKYLLKKSSGFTYSQNGGEMIRKRNLYKFRAGSVFLQKFGGDIYNVAPDNYLHSVESYAKALWISDLIGGAR